jgi:large subunit ribosomal protein L10
VNRLEKERCVATLKEKLSKSRLLVITKQSGLTVSQVTKLRRSIYESGSHFQVVKNTIATRAFEGTNFKDLVSHLKGPVAIALSEDPISAAKIIYTFAKTNDKIEIISGCLDGDVLTKASVEHLATLPSLEELRGKIAGLLIAPAGKIARVLKESGASLARVISANASKE